MVPRSESVPVAVSAGVVLVADDDAFTRGSITEILSGSGYECRQVEDGIAAKEMILRGDCDLLIADIRMPGNSQLELVQELAEARMLPPVVLVTGFPTVETAAAAVKFNAVGYLIKPVNPEELLRLVRQGVDGAQVLRHLRTRRAQIEQLLAEVRRLEASAHSILRQQGEEALSTYLSLSMEHILTSFTDLRNLVEAIVRREDASRARERLAESRPFLLLSAVREAIHVLEQTKGAFKSRELAELRRKLEMLLASDHQLPRREGARGAVS